MEELADLWQLAEQLARKVALACDAPADTRTACRGWKEFTDLEIQSFCSDLTVQAQGRIP
jgi:phosphoribosylformimino-5-aminoimidazole carboxamide ribonucleotide (ProFAR) isomerase